MNYTVSHIKPPFLRTHWVRRCPSHVWEHRRLPSAWNKLRSRLSSVALVVHLRALLAAVAIGHQSRVKFQGLGRPLRPLGGIHHEKMMHRIDDLTWIECELNRWTQLDVARGVALCNQEQVDFIWFNHEEFEIEAQVAIQYPIVGQSP